MPVAGTPLSAVSTRSWKRRRTRGRPQPNLVPERSKSEQGLLTETPDRAGLSRRSRSWARYRLPLRPGASGVLDRSVGARLVRELHIALLHQRFPARAGQPDSAEHPLERRQSLDF